MTTEIEKTTDRVSGAIAADKLKNFIERIESLEQTKTQISDDISDIYKEAKFYGFDGPTMKTVIKIRKMDAQKLQEQEHLLDLYRNALGI